MTAHPHEVLARELFAALADHELATLQILLAPTVVFHVPGRHLASGDYCGFEGVVALWQKLTRLSAGSFALEPEEVLTGARYAAVVGMCAAERAGRRLEQRAVCLIQLGGGRVVEGWLHSFDQPMADAFWS